MTTPFKAACVQLNAGNDLAANLAAAGAGIRMAVTQGATFILTPEYCVMMDGSGRTMRERAQAPDGGEALAAFRGFARETGAWLLAGSLTCRGGDADPDRIVNRSFLLRPDGEVAATYDKIHMFDVTLPDGRQIRESSAYRPGDVAVVADTPWGGLGMTICYDVRFPGLYRALAQAGAQYLAVPSSFTAQTGPAHWKELLRARAIETTCFVFAPAMCGQHPGNRATHGHSLIIDPWGRVLVEGSDVPGVFVADIDPAAVAKARAMIPSLEHDRAFRVARGPG